MPPLGGSHATVRPAACDRRGQQIAATTTKMTLADFGMFTVDRVRKRHAARFLRKTALIAEILYMPLHLDYRSVPQRKLVSVAAHLGFRKVENLSMCPDKPLTV